MTGHELQALRRLFFYSVPEAAAQVGGVSERAWRLWESGARSVPEDVAGRMGELLDLRRRVLTVAESRLSETDGCTALVWYETLDDWLTLAGRHPAQWRLSQSLAAELVARHADRIALVPFVTPAYAAWLAGRTDSESLRAAWALAVAIGERK